MALTICFCVARTFLTQAQETTAPAHRYVGIGIRSSVFQISELPIKTIPPNKIFLNVDPVKYIRVEGHYGMYSNSSEQIFSTFPNGTITIPLKENSTIIGGGIFGIYPKDNMKFMGGFRLSRNTYSKDETNSSGGGTPYVVTDNGEISITAFILGAEYSFNKWFSVGAEFGIVSMNDTFHPWDKNIPSTTSTTTITESGIVFRFYPY